MIFGKRENILFCFDYFDFSCHQVCRCLSLGERQIFLVEGHVEQKSFSFWHLACCSPGSVAVFARISINHFVIAVASGNDDLAGIGESFGVGYDAGFGLFHVFQPDATHGLHVFLHHLAGAL